MIIRFSSLGDVLIAAQLPSFLRRADSEHRVLFVTKSRYGPVLRGHPDIDRLYLLDEATRPDEEMAVLAVRGKLRDLAVGLRRERVVRAFDLHQNWRSSRIMRAIGGVVRVTPEKHGLRRRLWVHARWLNPKPVPPLLATYRAVAGLDPDEPPRPWLRDALTDEERARARARLGLDPDAGFVLLGTGARWATKRWPIEHFARLGDLLESRGVPVRYAIEPGDRDACAALSGIAGDAPKARVLEGSFRSLAATAAFARAVVSNDSAVLHLGAALGVSSIGIFGSTVPEFGFASGGALDRVVETRMPCRPCHVHGRSRCPLRHHGCLRSIEPEQVLRVLEPLLEASPSGERSRTS